MATNGSDPKERMEAVLARLLRAGVLLAAGVVLAGGVHYLLKYGGAVPSFQTFQGEPHDLTKVPGILRAALAGHSRGLIQLGLLLLIATPVVRVAVSAVVFARQRDRTYVLLTLAVLTVLLASLAARVP